MDGHVDVPALMAEDARVGQAPLEFQAQEGLDVGRFPALPGVSGAVHALLQLADVVLAETGLGR